MLSRSTGGWLVMGALLTIAASETLRRPIPIVRGGSELSLVVVTLDTTRADRLGAYGFPIQTPNLDRLAREGIVFDQTTSAAPLTLPSHASLFTGRFPISHGVRANGEVLAAPAHTTLSEVLRDRGFRTGAFVGSYVLDARFGLSQGFDIYSDEFDGKNAEHFTASSLQRPAGEVVDRALPWIEKMSSSRFFAWLHFYDAHAPYDPPEPYRTMFASDPYVGELAYVDAQVGHVLEFLRTKRLLERTIVVAIGDHGEGLGDHGELTHGQSLYESTVRVPFIVRLPGQVMAGRRVSAPTRSVDVMPTLLDLLGIAAPAPVDGRSLEPLIRGATGVVPLEAYAEAPLNESTSGSPRMLRSGEFKLIATPSVELYDLDRDPGETLNLARDCPDLARRMMTRLHEVERAAPSSQDGAPSGWSVATACRDQEKQR